MYFHLPVIHTATLSSEPHQLLLQNPVLLPLSALFCFQVVNRRIQRLFEQPVIPVSVVIKNFIECHYLTVLKWWTVQQKQTQIVKQLYSIKN